MRRKSPFLFVVRIRMNDLVARIHTELLAYPLVPTAYHRKLGAGASHTFGLVPRRGLAPEMSSISYLRAKLYKLLVELGQLHKVSGYTSITIQHNYTLVRRKEKTGGKATLILLGEYVDSGVKIGARGQVIQTLNDAVEIDTSKECLVPSAVSSGDRYVILYHTVGHAIDSPVFEVSANGSVNLLSGELSALSGQHNKFWIETKTGKIDFS